MANRYVPLEDRFWSRVRKTPECWIWEGFKYFGYGRLSVGGRSVNAHRISWFLRHGEWPPKGMFVCHSCDNPSCVNPNHLWIGTSADNNRDRHRKGRGVYVAGERQGSSKLTADDVRNIRRMANAGHSFYELAKTFDIHKETVSKVARGKSWKHITDPPPLPARQPRRQQGADQ